MCKPSQNWLLKIDERYVTINKIVTHFGDELCQVLPAYHSITGCDTSYAYGVGKIKLLKKMIKNKKYHLLSSMGRSISNQSDNSDAKIFVQTCMYPGTGNETFTQTRLRMFNKQKIKSSMSILPDENSLNEHIKRSDLQSKVWYQCMSKIWSIHQ